MARAFGYYWFSHASMALMVTVLWADAGSVEASIVLTEGPLLDVERLLAESDGPFGSGSSGSSSSVPNPEEQPFDRDSRRDDPNLSNDALFGQFQPVSGGTTSGTSAVASGTSATGTFAIDSTACVPLADTELLTWVGGERSFTLPTPPDNELLRPPQVL